MRQAMDMPTLGAVDNIDLVDIAEQSNIAMMIA